MHSNALLQLSLNRLCRLILKPCYRSFNGQKPRRNTSLWSGKLRRCIQKQVHMKLNTCSLDKLSTQPVLTAFPFCKCLLYVLCRILYVYRNYCRINSKGLARDLRLAFSLISIYNSQPFEIIILFVIKSMEQKVTQSVCQSLIHSVIYLLGQEHESLKLLSSSSSSEDT